MRTLQAVNRLLIEIIPFRGVFPRSVRLSCALVLALVMTPRGLAAQVSFEQAIRDLANPDAGVRLRAVQLLKEAAYPEAAIPLAPLIADPDDTVKLEAIAAELNIFLAEKIVPRKRVALVIEVRNSIAAEAAFSGGPAALNANPVPTAVLTALRRSARDPNPRVAVEALYAFGTLAGAPSGNQRRDLLQASGADLAAMLGVRDPALRLATIRILERVFERRPHDDPIDVTVGDAVIAVLNEKDRGLRAAAIRTLGAMRYDRAAQSLTDLFEDYRRSDLAEASLDALARIAHESSAPLFSSLMTAKGAAKGIAIEGLTRIGDPTALTAIQSALGADRDEGVVLAGTFANVVLGGAPIEPLAEALTRPRLRDQARRYLIEIAPGHTAAFGRYVQDPDTRMRAAIADILGLAGDPAALSIVEPLMKDRDPEVVLAAERAVARLRTGR